ncbi:MAG: hypothetical protein Faunusvirus1_64 [Faunusvirus sp.]|jgi:hypothetical protein|uniref:Uncharacterized protein n=1 Tax=Faunusvirus sp. TaxID=2487766 RepID=A0A3G4ZXH9_9VIRU|nr:MAG: hypothetical protein Faunusvirus1_64 [Faunusvirus sp.]
MAGYDFSDPTIWTVPFMGYEKRVQAMPPAERKAQLEFDMYYAETEQERTDTKYNPMYYAPGQAPQPPKEEDAPKTEAKPDEKKGG